MGQSGLAHVDNLWPDFAFARIRPNFAHVGANFDVEVKLTQTFLSVFRSLRSQRRVGDNLLGPSGTLFGRLSWSPLVLNIDNL